MKRIFLLYVIMSIGQMTYAQSALDIDKNLILWIPVTNDSSKLDRSLFHHDIKEIKNVVFDYDKNGEHNAYTFHGSSYIEMNQKQEFSYSTITICAWVKSSQTDKIGRIVVLPTQKGGQVYSLNLNLSSSNKETSLGKASIYFDKEDETGANSVLSSTNVCDNQWHFIVGVINTQTHLLKIYVDGENENQKTFTSRPRTIDSKNLQIGRFSQEFGEYLFGSLDEIRLYSRELSIQEIRQLYNQ